MDITMFLSCFFISLLFLTGGIGNLKTVIHEPNWEFSPDEKFRPILKAIGQKKLRFFFGIGAGTLLFSSVGVLCFLFYENLLFFLLSMGMALLGVGIENLRIAIYEPFPEFSVYGRNKYALRLIGKEGLRVGYAVGAVLLISCGIGILCSLDVLVEL